MAPDGFPLSPSLQPSFPFTRFFTHNPRQEDVREDAMGERLKDRVVFVTGAGSIGPGWGKQGRGGAIRARGREGLCA